MSAKDGKRKPAKVTGINNNGPCSYNIVTPEGRYYRRNRKDLRNLTNPVKNDTSVDDFLDDQEFDCDISEPIEPPRDYQTQSPAAPLTTLRRSQRNIRPPTRYADQFA